MAGTRTQCAGVSASDTRWRRRRLLPPAAGSLLLLPLAVVLLMLTEAWAAPRGLRRQTRAPVNDNVHNYLMTFGYLPQSDRETGNLRTEDQLRAAIRQLQTYGNIPVTGEVDAETRRLLRRPRCGMPDVEGDSNSRVRRYALHGRKWEYTNLTWSLLTTNPYNLDPRLVRDQLSRALNVWAENSKLTFQEVNTQRADILVFFEKGYHGDGYPFDGKGQILAHAFFPGDGRGGDAHFDEDETWLLDEISDESEGTSLFAVAAHEFGHSLGLSHSSVPGALMYPWYQGIKPNFQLPDDDRHGIQQLYGAKEDRLWGRRPPIPTTPVKHYPPRTTTTTTTTTTTPRPRVEVPRKPHPRRPTQSPHRPHHRPNSERPRHPEHNPQSDEKPNTCDTSYDAVSIIRREVFIFKGKYFWRIGERGLGSEYPAEVWRLWHSLPKNLTHVDAVYERNDKKIVFFVGKHYYVFDGNTLLRGYPQPLTALGLPPSLEKIDAAMVWGYNMKTYFFSGTMYWRFDEEVGTVELDYPRDMSMWKGIGYNIDAVFQWKDGKTYFFKGKGYWKFNDLRMRVEHERPMLSAPMWMGCPRGLENPEEREQDPVDRSGLREENSQKIASGAVRHGFQSVVGALLIAHFIGFIRI